MSKEFNNAEFNNAKFNTDDFFTYNIKNNKVTSGGYEINSTLLKKQVPLIGMNKLNGLAIPVGLLHLSQNNEKEPLEEIYDETPLQEDIYDKLLKLMNEPDKKPEKINKKNKTRKPIKTPSRFTKKNKKIKINRNK
jgi:hypothetical protein